MPRGYDSGPLDCTSPVAFPNIRVCGGIAFDQAYGRIRVVVTAAPNCHTTAAFVVDTRAA